MDSIPEDAVVEKDDAPGPTVAVAVAVVAAVD